MTSTGPGKVLIRSGISRVFAILIACLGTTSGSIAAKVRELPRRKNLDRIELIAQRFGLDFLLSHDTLKISFAETKLIPKIRPPPPPTPAFQYVLFYGGEEGPFYSSCSPRLQSRITSQHILENSFSVTENFFRPYVYKATF